jgi:cytochrome P450
VSVDAAYAELLRIAGGIEPGEDLRWDEERGTWLVGSYAAFKEVMTDAERWPANATSPTAITPGVDLETYVDFEGGPKKLPFLVGEEHDGLHRWWMRVFSPRQIAEWRELALRPIVHEAIDRFSERGSADLAGELGEVITLPMTLRMMELPSDDDFLARYFRPARAFGALRHELLTHPGDPAVTARAKAVAQELRDLLMPYVLERRSGEGGDLISRLWAVAPELLRPPWDEEAIFANVMALFEAGVSTVSGSLSYTLHVLAERPDLQERLREEGSEAVQRFVEETLRLYAPALFIRRFAAEDTEFRGATIRKGDPVHTVAIAANRDPERYACPHEIDLGRKGPRDHVAFGFGPRLCPGHAVGRAQMEECVVAVVARLCDLRPDPDAEPGRLVGNAPRVKFDRIPVRFAPSPRRA